MAPNTAKNMTMDVLAQHEDVSPTSSMVSPTAREYLSKLEGKERRVPVTSENMLRVSKQYRIVVTTRECVIVFSTIGLYRRGVVWLIVS
jgi:hypothetical protein